MVNRQATNLYQFMQAHTKALGISVLFWLIVGMMQTLHFHYYYKQPWGQSLFWSYRDWLIWLVIAWLLYKIVYPHVFKNRSFTESFIMLFAVAIIAGGIQVLLIIVTDFLVAGISRPFWQDFLHLYKKRWFLNLFIFALLWILMHKIVNLNVKQADESVSAELSKNIKIIDGKQHFWLKPADIYAIESTGNYACFHTTQGQKIARQTLKSLTEELTNQGFLRINRSCLINTSHIKLIEKNAAGANAILTNGNTHIISRRRWGHLKKIIDTNQS